MSQLHRKEHFTFEVNLPDSANLRECKRSEAITALQMLRRAFYSKFGNKTLSRSDEESVRMIACLTTLLALPYCAGLRGYIVQIIEAINAPGITFKEASAILEIFSTIITSINELGPDEERASQDDQVAASVNIETLRNTTLEEIPIPNFTEKG